ncbi:MAG: ribosome biogenesis GTP-binding protein YihA/YsxC [Caldibacillus sp.]
MKIKTAEFIISAVSPKQYPAGDLPEIALAGRSNVGKSSFINRMVNRKSLARTSQKPGKTQTLNYYLINDAFYFVDVPGYGFAQVSKSERASWGKMIETYLLERKQLKCVIQIVDIRHEPTADDRMMMDFLKYYQLPTIVIATKADKISRGKWNKHLKQIRDGLQLEKGTPLIPFSAKTGEGKEEAWQVIRQYIGVQDESEQEA